MRLHRIRTTTLRELGDVGAVISSPGRARTAAPGDLPFSDLHSKGAQLEAIFVLPLRL